MNVYWEPLLIAVCLSTISCFLLLFSTDRLYGINIFPSLFLRSFKRKLVIKIFPVKFLHLLKYQWLLHAELPWFLLFLPPLLPTPSSPGSQELVRLLQQTVRSSQYDKYFTSSRLCEGVPQDTLGLLHQKDDQILGLTSQLERFNQEKESLQQEVRTLKNKVGELSEQLGMLMETIQAKDEVIMKLSRQLSECEGSASSPTSMPSSPVALPTARDQLELDRLKVRAGRGPLLLGREIQNPLTACLLMSL